MGYLIIDKDYLEKRIAELELTYQDYACWEEKYGELETLKRIYNEAKDFEVLHENTWNFRLKNDEGYISETFAIPQYVSAYLQKRYPNGVIIKPDTK